MSHPYNQLPATAFWRSAVAEQHPLDIDRLWTPKHSLAPTHRIVTAGSCFAQHIGRALAARGYNWFDAEPAPTFLSEALRKEFNYGIFSFRTGNIYTTALLKQWLCWALQDVAPPDEAWLEDGRWFDPFRPGIEPSGFISREEMLASRATTLRAIRRAATEANVLVFTLGLTEGWIHGDQGHVYPMCPGTLHGTFSPAVHQFRNYKYPEIRRDLAEAMNMVKAVNPRMRFLLTVSPVPLTATASGAHVLSATTYSKSALRAVAGDLAERGDTDYFPSYEIITGFPYRGMFFQPNMRNVSPHGVNHVMKTFFSGLGASAAPSTEPRARQATPTGAEVVKDDEAEKCEEELLSAFGPRGR